MTRKNLINTDNCKDRVSFRFKREEHLKGRSRIREVFSKGKRFYTVQGPSTGNVPDTRKGFPCSLGLFVLKNGLPFCRICFSFTKAGSRKFGSAVARNRAKRLGREAFRLLKAGFSGGYDLILIINPDPADNKLTLSGMMESLQSLFKKAGIID